MNATTSTSTVEARGRRWRRIAFIAILMLALLAGAIVIGLQFYLNSTHAREVAATRLTEMIGMPVEVEHLAVGSEKTEITLKSAAAGQAEPLFSIASITADVSLLDVLAGRANPKELVLKGVKIVVPLDREGRLLAALPKASSSSESATWPYVRIEDAAIRVHQEGRPDFFAEKLQLNASTKDDRYVVSGHFDDPRWGRWKVSGSYLLSGESGSIELSSADAPLQRDLLHSIPAVPPETWDHVEASGRTAADIRFNFGKEFTYAVLLKPAGAANLTLPDLDVPLTQLSGAIRIAGEKVTIEKCQAALADGMVNVDGTLDFEPEKSKLSFQVSAAGLDLQKLPAAWALPQQITGKLRGKADLELTVSQDGRLEPRGGGEATVDGARLANLPAEVKLRLRGDGRRYRFESQQMSLLPQPEPLTMPVNVILQEPKPEPKREKPEATTLDAQVTLRDVDIAELLKQIEVQVPYKLAGKVTVQVMMAVPVGEVAARASYRFKGTLTSTSFRFEDLEVRDVAAEIRYRDGVLTLTELKATFPVKDGPAGKLVGTAKAEVEPPGDITASLTLADIPSGEIRNAFPGIKLDLRGGISGKADLRIPFNHLKDITTWTGTSSLTAKSLASSEGTIEKLSAKATLDKGVIKLTEARADLFKGTIEGSADVPLSAAKAGRLTVEFKDVDSAAATKLIPDFPVPLTGRVSGKVAATADAVKDAQPRLIAADLNVAAPKMTVRGIPAERLTGKVSVSKRVADYSLEGRSLGGTFEVKGRYPATASDAERGHLRLRNLDLARLAAAVNAPWFKPLSGIVNLNFDYEADGSVGLGRLSVTGLKWGRDTLASDLNGSLMLTDGTVDLRDFGGSFANGRLRLRARYDFDDPRRNFYTLTLDRASMKRLAALVPLESPDGEANLVARGRLFGPAAGGSLTLTLAGVTLGGLPVTQVSIPIEWTGGLAAGRVIIRDGGLRFGNGSLTSNVAFDYGPVSRLSGSIRFQDVQIRSLISSSSTFGNGRISGRFDLGGEAIRNLDDVTGTLNATLNQTSVREVPLIRVVTPFLQPIGFLQPFEAGEVKGRLAKGIFRLERFALSNPGANIFAEGSITRAGRVNLDVVAMTGQVGPNPRLLQLVGLAAIGPLPLTTIQYVSDLLSNRTVRLTVTGTLAAPSVKVNKAALLTDTAARFFLGQYIVPRPATGPR